LKKLNSAPNKINLLNHQVVQQVFQMINSYGIILLAAGSSGRLGSPKQLLLYKNKNLLQYLVDEATASSSNTVIVVLGAGSEEIASKIQAKDIHIVFNKDWKEGMASSIRCGILELQKINPATTAVILMTCDQPFVSTALLNKLITTHQLTNKLIVTSTYDNTTGPPALFQQALFPELLQLQGDAGARVIVQQYAAQLGTVSFPEGNIDIDTAMDYEHLVQ
jgi:molybdenum cofactor cytidylyltransferase